MADRPPPQADPPTFQLCELFLGHHESMHQVVPPRELHCVHLHRPLALHREYPSQGAEHQAKALIRWRPAVRGIRGLVRDGTTRIRDPHGVRRRMLHKFLGEERARPEDK